MDKHPAHTPAGIIWELTYACPFRCEHCYSESGRRPAHKLPRERLLRIADAILKLRPLPVINFAGGEPLLLKEMTEIAERLRAGGAQVKLYTSGWRLRPDIAQRVADVFTCIGVSMDGPDPQVNDVLRGREGAFDQAMGALRLWDQIAGERARRGGLRFELGIECTMMRSNLPHLERFCTEVAPSLPNLSFLMFGVVMPVGLASRLSFCERELPTGEQQESMAGLRQRLRDLAPDAVRLNWCGVDNLLQIARAEATTTMMTIEPDGAVKAHPLYEGNVGNALDESLAVLWRRSQEWAEDPFVVEQLATIHSLADWAAVAHNLDMRFCSAADRQRLARREPVRLVQLRRQA